jgi:hypothetical protein
MDSFDAKKVLPQNFVIKGAENHLYKIGLNLKPNAKEKRKNFYNPLLILSIVGQLTASAFDFDRSDGQSHGQNSKILSAVKVTFTNFSCGQS